ncbi:9276_t:CDS:2 [Diversispora eburnea]|uniref:9276_t:CDS:1 n=1 Tax=Diversispora eburnea TaxID=1213867 RepID=A0A9N8VHV4_9GLOM|nr:9276_t:CDS:2 [Diversispora eburnea]
MLRKFPLIFRFFNSRKLIFPHGFAKYNYLSNKLLQTNTLHVTKRFLNQNEKSVFLREFIAIHNNTGIKHCWKCNSEIDFRSPRCDNKECGVIQEPLSEDLSYFEVLRVNEDRDFTPTFDINLNRLRSSFLKLQQRFHPDSYGFKDSSLLDKNIL